MLGRCRCASLRGSDGVRHRGGAEAGGCDDFTGSSTRSSHVRGWRSDDPARRLLGATRPRPDHRRGRAAVERPRVARRVRAPSCTWEIVVGADASEDGRGNHQPSGKCCMDRSAPGWRWNIAGLPRYIGKGAVLPACEFDHENHRPDPVARRRSLRPRRCKGGRSPRHHPSPGGLRHRALRGSPQCTADGLGRERHPLRRHPPGRARLRGNR